MLAQKVAYNTLIQIFGKVVGFFVSGILLVAISQQLGTYNMGNYVTVVAFVAFFVNVADLGANVIMVRDIAQNPDRREQITREFIGFRFSFSLVIMLLAPIVAQFIPQYSELIIKGSIIVTIAQFILLLNQSLVSVLQTQLMLDKAVLAEIANRITTLLLVLAIIRAGISGDDFFYAVLYATLAGSGVNLLISFLFARRLWTISPTISFAAWQKTLSLIAPIGLFTFLGMVHFKADTILLSLFKTPLDVGIYGYAYKIAEILFTFPIMFLGTVVPRLSQLFVTNRAKFNHFSQLALDVLLVGTVPFLAFVFIGSRYFTLLLSRSSVSDGIIAGQVLQILCLAMIVWFIGNLFINILIIANDYRGLIRNLVIAVALNIGLNAYFIPHHSYYGAAIVTVITEFVMFGLTLAYTARNVKFIPRWNLILPVGMATSGMLVCLWWIQRLPFFTTDVFVSQSRMGQMLVISLFAFIAMVSFGLILLVIAGNKLKTTLASLKSHD